MLEYRDRAQNLPKRMRHMSAGDVARGANDAMESAHHKCNEAIESFDDAFNERWYRLGPEMRRRRQEFQQRLRGGKAASEESSSSSSSSSTAPAAVVGPSVDTTAAVLMSVGISGAYQGYPMFVLLTIWGASRGACRFVTKHVDANDMEGMFRYAPASVRAKKVEHFARLQREVETARALRRGDLRYTDLSWLDRGGTRPQPGYQEAMDPRYDHTPETLYDETMEALIVHPRVIEVVGGDIRAQKEPDKVVYRIVEGIAEVYLGWHIVGSNGAAEVQVKATASIVDFIYIFPQATAKYQMDATAFVIRPQGTWSMDAKDLPYDAKQPFGFKAASGRLQRHKSGVFEWDWSVREFRHGYENHPRGRRQ